MARKTKETSWNQKVSSDHPLEVLRRKEVEKIKAQYLKGIEEEEEEEEEVTHIVVKAHSLEEALALVFGTHPSPSIN